VARTRGRWGTGGSAAHNHEAIAAAISATREGIGVARFVRSREQPEHAEIAINHRRFLARPRPWEFLHV